MPTTATAYLTGFGSYLPGPAIDNDGIVSRLGGVDTVTERIRRSILDSNGIKQRHYALDEHGEPTELNEELAVKALTAALDDRGIQPSDLRMLATATTMGDVRARLRQHGARPARRWTDAAPVRVGCLCLEPRRAGCRGQQDPARRSPARRRGGVRAAEPQPAAAPVRGLQGRHGRALPAVDAVGWRGLRRRGVQPHPSKPSLRVDWIRQVSLAHDHAVCMRAGMTISAAAAAGAGRASSSEGGFRDRPPATTRVALCAGLLDQRLPARPWLGFAARPRRRHALRPAAEEEDTERDQPERGDDRNRRADRDDRRGRRRRSRARP